MRGVPSGAILFAWRKFIKNGIKIKIYSNVPENESGLFQMILMGKSIRQNGLRDLGYLQKSYCQGGPSAALQNILRGLGSKHNFGVGGKDQ